MNLSENIKSIREEKRISQSELAKRLGVEPTNYPRLEKRGNSLTYEYIELFAKALEVSVAELLSIGNSPTENKEIETLKIEIENLRKVVESANHRVRDFEVRASMFDKIEKYYLDFFNDEIYYLLRPDSHSYNGFPDLGHYAYLASQIDDPIEKFNSLSFIIFITNRDFYQKAIEEFSALRESKIIHAWKRFTYIDAIHLNFQEHKQIIGEEAYKSYRNQTLFDEVVDLRVKTGKFDYKDFEIKMMKEKNEEYNKRLVKKD